MLPALRATPAVLLLIASAVAAGSAPLKDSLHHAGSSTESIAVLQRAAWPVPMEEVAASAAGLAAAKVAGPTLVEHPTVDPTLAPVQLPPLGTGAAGKVQRLREAAAEAPDKQASGSTSAYVTPIAPGEFERPLEFAMALDDRHGRGLSECVSDAPQ